VILAPRTRKISAVPSGSSPERAGLAGKITETLGALPLTPADAAAGELALLYGRLLDRLAPLAEQIKTAADLGPRLLAVLTALGATPAARVKSPPAPQESRLSALRGELA
jgi:hypothetical protein